jgi:hypothetical protein
MLIILDHIAADHNLNDDRPHAADFAVALVLFYIVWVVGKCL